MFEFLVIAAFYIIFHRTTKRLRLRADALEQALAMQTSQLAALQRRLDGPAGTAQPTPATVPEPKPAPRPPPPAPTPAPEPVFVPTPVLAPAAAFIPKPAAAPVPAPAEAVTPAPPKPAPRPPAAPRPPVDTTPAWVKAAKHWLFSGNLVAKLGLLILFIGVSFLLKYAAERVTVPIELRLAGVVLTDIALLVWGWRIRESRRAISLPVQGAALAILMLVTFAAFRRFELIPGGLAFGLLFVLTFFTCLLAVLQNAVWLAVFGISGGFLAPIMTSTGHGSHIALFSYYALLNAGILGIALKRAWRSLNLLGFAFTFVIGTAWGVLRYVPENYLSTQLFLILFVVFYVAIAIAYATRQAPQLKNHVDATLVFGVPLVAFGLQYGMVKSTQFGLAFSALGLGLFYTSVALVLWRRGRDNFKLLVESFLALGVVFGTLALPFALDGRWTSAAWALEGAGVVWVGLRQRQPLTVLFGLLVQAGAWVSFIGAISGISSSQAAAEANLWLGFLLLAGTAFLMATNFRRHDQDVPSLLHGWAAGLFLAVAAVWLVLGAWIEIFVRTDGSATTTLLAASALAIATILGMIARRMAWRLARVLALAVQVLAGLLLLGLTALGAGTFGGERLLDTPILGALLIFAGALFSSRAMQRLAPDDFNGPSRALLLWSGFWWYAPVLTILANWADWHFAYDDVSSAVYGILVALSALVFCLAARRLAWPFMRWLGVPAWAALAAGTVLILMHLYGGGKVELVATVALAALLVVSEFLMRQWPANGWPLATPALKALHTLRTAGPWLMIWPAGGALIMQWLYGAAGAQQALLDQAGWQTSGSWGRYIPAWIMMLAIVWVVGRARAGKWPTTPVSAWYRQVLVPLGTGWSLLLAAVWNLAQDGTMSPLPYLPVLNPLDLTSGFALLLAVVCYRMAHAAAHPLSARMPAAIGVAAYLWFNLMLLRSAAHYLGIAYQFAPLFASQFIQAMLSLVWSISALVLMLRGARRMSRPLWIVGAVLLGMVVGKLFLVDLSNVGGVARIISFVGVGLLMVVIGYIAPFPTPHAKEPEAQAS